MGTVKCEGAVLRCTRCQDCSLSALVSRAHFGLSLPVRRCILVELHTTLATSSFPCHLETPHATMAMLQRRQNHESTQDPASGSGSASGSSPSPSAECRQCKTLIAGHMHVLAQGTHPWARAPRRLGRCPAPRLASQLCGPPACPPRQCRPRAPARPPHTPPEVHHMGCNSEARVSVKLLLDAATVRRRRLVHELKSVACRNILPDHCASLASTSPDREVSQHLEKQHHTWYL